MVIGGHDEMPPLEEYLKHVDKLAQQVVNAWGIGAQAGLAPTPQFRALLDKACLYRTVRRLADDHRKFDVMSEQGEVEELSARHAFAEAYKAFYGKQTAAS